MGRDAVPRVLEGRIIFDQCVKILNRKGVRKMAYEKINSIQQFNFQINRVLTYGEQACDAAAVRTVLKDVKTLPDWRKAWLGLAQRAETEGRWLHAAYAYRMVEFFASQPEKETVYAKCLALFERAFAEELHLDYERREVPFAGKRLSTICLRAAKPKATVLVCGGYDSFIEEFLLQVSELTERGYTVILFEGPGQGRSLRQGLYFQPDFERSTQAVLEASCAMVGISWGGYFALRSAAYEPRIVAAAAYDVLTDGIEVMTGVFPQPIASILRFCLKREWLCVVNALTSRLRQKSLLADWALTQGEYITGTQTAVAFYEALRGHSLYGLTERLTQDILLLAGEKDHYVPLTQYEWLRAHLPNARSVTARLFTAAEGGEQHCQVGAHQLAVEAIVRWLDGLFDKQQEAE